MRYSHVVQILFQVCISIFVVIRICIREITYCRFRVCSEHNFPPVRQTIHICIKFTQIYNFLGIVFPTTGIILMIDQSRLSGFTTFISSCSIQSFFYNTYIMIIKHRQCTSDVRKYRFVGIFCCMNSGKRFKERFCHKRIIFLITIWP